MCGIAGAVGAFTREEIAGAALRMSHRGPDDAGFWSNDGGSCHLAHRRLSIIDLSPAGHQPMWDESGTCVVVFNGEIYNYRELRRDLESAGCRLRGNSDTEVLVNLFRLRGPSFVRDLNGIFSLAIHDVSSGKTFLARDGFGVKPLYYARLSRGIVFASEIKALLPITGVSGDLDPFAVAGYLGLLFAPSPHTPVKSVKKWPAGQFGEILSSGEIRVHVNFSRASMVAHSGPTASPEQLTEVFDRAVKRQLVSDAKVGAFLSGGIDSSAIVASAAAGGTALHCYTLRPKESNIGRDAGAEDLPYAREVARHCGAELTELDVSVDDLASVDSLVGKLEEPQADPAALFTFLLSERARQDGHKVMLSGAGGDELFGGYRRHLSARAMPLWMWLPPDARARVTSWATNFSTERPLTRRFGKLLSHLGEDEDGQVAGLNLWLSDAQLGGLLSEGMREELAGCGNLKSLRSQVRAMPAGLSTLQKSLLLDQRNFLPDQNLNYSDKMGMAAGVEIRVPFLDDELVAFANALPDYQKCGWSGTKILLKQAFARRLPASLVRRPKQGFGVPLREWMQGPLGPRLNEYATSTRIRTQGVFDAAGLRRLIDLNQSGKVDATYTLYAVLCVDSWIRQFRPTL